MPIKWVDSEPGVRTIIVPFSYASWSVGNSWFQTGVRLPTTARIVSAQVFKSVPFNSGNIAFGHGVVAAERESMGTYAEVSAASAGTSELSAWRSGTYSSVVGGFNGLLAAGFRDLGAYFSGATLPTTGAGELVIVLRDISPRATL